MGKRGSTPERVQVTGRRQGSWYWLIVRDAANGMEIFTLDIGGYPRTLPVFGSEEAAVRMLPSSGAWHARKTGRGELISVLCGPCGDAKLVALDPSPELVGSGMVELVSESAGGFVDVLLGRGRIWLQHSLSGGRATLPPGAKVLTRRAT